MVSDQFTLSSGVIRGSAKLTSTRYYAPGLLSGFHARIHASVAPTSLGALALGMLEPGAIARESVQQ
jgi:hypothetical protein